MQPGAGEGGTDHEMCCCTTQLPLPWIPFTVHDYVDQERNFFTATCFDSRQVRAPIPAVSTTVHRTSACPLLVLEDKPAGVTASLSCTHSPMTRCSGSRRLDLKSVWPGNASSQAALHRSKPSRAACASSPLEQVQYPSSSRAIRIVNMHGYQQNRDYACARGERIP
jgi:hypothetical protein